jgi:superfamily II DNA or RNA helicase
MRIRVSDMSGIAARRWQSEALGAWSANQRKGVVSVVTGAGKTVFALLAYQDVLSVMPDARLVVVVPTTALLDQWAITLATEGKIDRDEIALVSGESPGRKPSRATVVVLNTARKRASDLVGDGRCLLVVDECHRAGSPENAKALKTNATFTLGLSATPRREFDDGFETNVQPNLGPIVFEYGYVDAHRDGLIPPINMANFHFSLAASEKDRYELLTQRIGRQWGMSDDPHNDPALKRLMIQRSRVSISSHKRVVGAVAVAERFPGRGLIFHEQIPRAESITRLLDKRGVRVAIYHSNLGPSIRRRNLELFKFGQVTKLVTCRALDEGLNVPDAEVAIIAASTTSTRQRIQRFGRVLRVTDDKKTATVCTLFATDRERTKLEEEAISLREVASVKWFELKG